MRVLLIDDEVKLTDALSFMLKKDGYAVDIANDGLSGYDHAESGIYDVIVLDVMLPYKDGLTILKELRENEINTPIIMLTAKNSVEDKIKGLDLGADDYLPKPFSIEELLARIRALSRRKDTELSNINDIKVRNMTLMPNECLLKINNEEIKLKFKEMQIIEMLMNNFNRTVTREMLLDKVWGYDKDVDVNNIEAHVCFLRKKINFHDAGLKLETVRGIGYCLKDK
ncbi:MAG: response regulator transcription factor [Clostridia bacterium]|nr:response regulator transcription factor [Clostridia bacterium]